MSKLSTAELIGIGLLIIIVLSLIVWAIYGLFFHKKGNTEGEKCSHQNDCAAEHFCGGDNQCHKGANGKAEGAICANSGDCELGLKCTSKKCTKVS